jgi:hypothetical protein
LLSNVPLNHFKDEATMSNPAIEKKRKELKHLEAESKRLYITNKALIAMKKESGRALKYYLLTMLHMTEKSYYTSKKVIDFTQENYPTFGKTFYSTTAIPSFKKTGVFNVIYSGNNNKIMLQMPEWHPQTHKEWYKLDQGFTQLDAEWIRSKMLTISDTDLKLYLHFLSQSFRNTSCVFTTYTNELMRFTGVGRTTIFKKLKEYTKKGLIIKTTVHTGSKPTFQIALTDKFNKIFKSDLDFSKLAFKAIELQFKGNELKTSRFFGICTHKYQVVRNNRYINQKGSTAQNKAVIPNPMCQASRSNIIHFNFYGFDACSRNPLTSKSINVLVKSCREKGHTNVSRETIQVSLTEFKKAIDAGFYQDKADPVAYFCKTILRQGYFALSDIQRSQIEAEKKAKREAEGNVNVSEIIKIVEDHEEKASEEEASEVLSEIQESLDLENEILIKPSSGEEVSKPVDNGLIERHVISRLVELAGCEPDSPLIALFQSKYLKLGVDFIMNHGHSSFEFSDLIAE